jgi:tRNA pseudouridine65 synthase
VLEILYRDDELVAVHKPAGLMVHRSSLDSRETRFALQLVRSRLGRRVYPVHRLDRGTSGVLLFAFSAATAAVLGRAFESREVEKRYRAVVRGWPQAEGAIDHPLRRLADGKDTPRPGAVVQEARTEFRLVSRAEVPIPSRHHETTRVALLELRPLSGRQHQIRRHLKHASHPVLGDATYGKGPLNRAFADWAGVARLWLACTELRLAHPAAGRPLRLCAPPDPDFAALSVRLGWSEGQTA